MKARFVLLFSAVLLATAALGPASAQEISAAKKTEIDKLLQLTHALQLGQQMSSAIVKQITNQLHVTRPDIPQKALDVIPEEVDSIIAENMPAFKKIVIGIYARHFTLKDLKGLNRFYSSDLGRKVVGQMPAVLQESVLAGQQWGRSLAPEIQRRLRARFKQENVAL